MATGFPTKANWAAGDILTAAQMDDLAGTVNLLNPTAKGGLISASAANTPAVLTVGSDGQTLVADSSTSTGLRYQANYAAGKNVIINGDFFINQRSFTSTTTSGVYTFDRWLTSFVNGTNTYSAQTLTQSTGLLPLSQLSGSTFLRIVTAGQSAASDFSAISQRIENAATFQGKTVTVSFYAKAASGTPKVSVNLAANQLGVGQVSNPFGSVTISTNWVRYSLTATLAALAVAYTPSGSYLEAYLITSAGTSNATFASSIGSQNATIDFWGVQVEAGSVATAFQTATGTLQGELAACQRYYYQPTTGAYWNGQVVTTTTYYVMVYFPVAMRTAPTITNTSIVAGNFPATASSAAFAGTTSFANTRTANGTGAGGFADTYTVSAEL